MKYYPRRRLLAALLSFLFICLASSSFLFANTDRPETKTTFFPKAEPPLPRKKDQPSARASNDISLDYYSIKAGSYKEGSILIKFREGTGRSARQKLLAKKGMNIEREFTHSGVQLVSISQSMSVTEALAILINSPAVEYAEPNYLFSTCATPDDTRFSELWALENTGQSGGQPGADIDALQSWDISTGNGDVVVAVVDTGIEYTHEDLQANLWVNLAEQNGTRGVDDDQNGYIDDIYGINAIKGNGDPLDDNGHGTHVAGTIGAVGNNSIGITGVNWNTRIMSLKFLAADGWGYTENAVACLEYVMSMYDAGVNIKVVNCSWGSTSYSASLYEAIAALRSRDILLVAAAGNNESDNDIIPHYPSAYNLDNIISVAATDDSDLLSGFSNYGATSVDVGAPGEDILSTLPGEVSGPSSTVFLDDAETDTGALNGAGIWSRTTEKALGGQYSWTDSPGGNYQDNSSVTLTSSMLDLSAYSEHEVSLKFSGWLDIESGIDYLYVEVSGNGGITWNIVKQLSGQSLAWNSYTCDIPIQDRTSQFLFRFRLYTDSSNNYDGVYIDNIIIEGAIDSGYFFFDGAENGVSNWTADSPWEITSGAAYNGNNSWTDSLGTNYANDLDLSLVSETIDLSSVINKLVILKFYAKYDIEYNYDNLLIEVSGDDGVTWTEISRLSGSWPAWKYCRFFVPPEFFTSQFRFRFHLVTDSSVVKDGVYLDNIAVDYSANANNYGFHKGTSMATPHVSGLASLISSHWGNMDYLDLRDMIYATVDKTPSLQGKVKTNGRINAYSALLQDPSLLPPSIYSISPSQVPPNITVTVTGARFGSIPGVVTFTPNASAEIISWSDQLIRVTVPITARSGPVTITTANDISSSGFNALIGDNMVLHSFALTKVGRVAVAGLNDSIYLIGGYSLFLGNEKDLVQIYHPQQGYWEYGQMKPTPAAGSAAAVYDGKIYVVGGYRFSSGQYLNKLEIYDPATDVWDTSASPLPVFLAGARAEFVDGKLYVFGGNSNPSESSALFCYNPTLNNWSQLAPMENARAYFASGVIDGKIYAFGGYGNGAILASAEVYDPATDSWSLLQPMNTARYDLAGASFGGKLYAFGGNSQAEWNPPYLQSIEEYDPATDTWSVHSSILNKGRQSLGAAVVNSAKVYVLGGLSAEGYVDLTESLDPSLTQFDPVRLNLLTANPSSGVLPLTTGFNLTALGGSGNYSYLWNFGDGATSSMRNPSHTFSESNTFSVSVTVTDEINSDNFTSGTLQILTVPGPSSYSPVGIASFSANPTSGIAPQDVDFTVNAFGGSGNYLYSWNFGDAQSDQQNPGHTYNNPGTYNVTITVTDAEDVNNFTTGLLQVKIIAPPQVLSVKLSAAPATGPAPLSVALSLDVIGDKTPYQVTFNYGDGSAEDIFTMSSGSGKLYHDYTNAGTFEAWATVSSANGVGTQTLKIQPTVNVSSTQSDNDNSSFGAPPPKPCFISSLAGNSYLKQYLDKLRDFRDRHLMTNKPGRLLTALYYRLSPTAVNWLHSHERLAAPLRLIITPFILLLLRPFTLLACLLTFWLIKQRKHLAVSP